MELNLVDFQALTRAIGLVFLVLCSPLELLKGVFDTSRKDKPVMSLASPLMMAELAGVRTRV
jgi:hypothetical protein